MPSEATAEANETPPGLGAGPGEFTLGDILGDLNSEEEQDSAAPAKPPHPSPGPRDLKAKGKTPTAPVAKPKVFEVQKPAAPGELTEDFSDERPWTPERVKNAAKEAQELARNAQRQWTQLRKREEKFAQSKSRDLSERAREKALREQLGADLQILRTGNPRERLDALGRLSGTDGVRLWEEIELDLARGGKKAELTPGELALKAELEELKGRLQGREAQAELQRQARFVEQRKAQLGQVGLATQTVETDDGEEVEEPLFPELSLFEPDEIGDALAEVITRVYNESGKRISDRKAAEMLEQDLQARKAKRGSGLAPRAEKAAKPEKAPSPPPNRGRSLAPGLSTQSASRRELTDEEIQEDAADFIPASILRAASPR